MLFVATLLFIELRIMRSLGLYTGKNFWEKAEILH